MLNLRVKPLFLVYYIVYTGSTNVNINVYKKNTFLEDYLAKCD